MEDHSLKLLEFDKVKEILKGYTSSGLGKQVADRTYPLQDAGKIVVCQEQTTEVRNLLDARMRVPVGGMHDISEAVASTATAGAPLEPGVLLDIRSTLEASAELNTFCSGLGKDYPRLSSLAKHFLRFDAICKSIARVIDERGTVRDDASPKLAELRRRIESLKREIREKAYSLTQSGELRNALQDSNVTVRHERYTLSVRSEMRHHVPGVIHDHSQTGQTVFIEPQELVALGNQLDDARFEERQEVSRILWELTLEVGRQREEILRTVRALAWFDFTYAKARFSLAFKMSQPKLSTDGKLSLEQARHPLLMWLAEKDGTRATQRSAASQNSKADPFEAVVPINVRLGDDFNLLVITGPNTGGKTVTLKTIGLLSVMAQAGMHIPADKRSEVPLFRNVFIDVGDEQSIEASLSTFSSHMSRIVDILGRADRRSLVLLDELGAGTDPTEGAALGTAILDHLSTTGARVAVTTHLGSLKSYAYNSPLAQNASVEFDEKTLMPTYRLIIGHPGSSNALAIARRLGLPERVSSRAREILASEDPKGRELINRMAAAASEAERQREEASGLRKDAEELKAQYERELEAARNLRGRLAREAEVELHTALTRVKGQVEAALNELRQGPKNIAERAEALGKEIEAEIERTPLGQKHASFVKELRQGDIVYVPKFDAAATVYEIDRKKGRVRLKLGKATLETSFEEISWAK